MTHSIQDLVMEKLEEKKGSNNIKMAYTIGCLISLINEITKKHPDVAWIVHRKFKGK